jgi:Pseudouridylate synthases, 23S RNA-specific
MNKIKTFSVEKIGNNPRLDKFLAAKFNDITRTQIKKIIISKNLSINNKIVSSPSQKVRIGDKISFSISENKNEYIKPEKIKIDIVYEDNDLIVLDKPSGIVVHPGAGNKSGT